jgi:CotH kinase protein
MAMFHSKRGSQTLRLVTNTTGERSRNGWPEPGKTEGRDSVGWALYPVKSAFAASWLVVGALGGCSEPSGETDETYNSVDKDERSSSKGNTSSDGGAIDHGVTEERFDGGSPPAEESHTGHDSTTVQAPTRDRETSGAAVTEPPTSGAFTSDVVVTEAPTSVAVTSDATGSEPPGSEVPTSETPTEVLPVEPPTPALELAAPPEQVCHVSLACAEEIADEPKVNCDVSVTLGEERVYEGLCGVERRGRSSLLYPKGNYAIELREEDGSNRGQDFFGFGKDEDWILDGSWVDRSFMRNTLVSDLFRGFSATWYAPESGYCTLEVNGAPQGIYRLVERIKRGDERVPLVKDDGTGASFVIKQEKDGYLRLDVGLESGWEATYPNNPTAAQIQGIQTWLDQFSAALATRSDAEDGVFQLLNRHNVVDWVLLQEFAKNIDAYKLSIIITKDRAGLARLVPWDFDLAFGQPTVNDGTELVTAHETSGWVVQRTPFLQDIVAVPGFGEVLSARWRTLRQGPLREAVIDQQLSAYERVIADATTENFTVWPITDVAFEPIFSRFHLYEVASFDEELVELRTWITQRLTWIDEHIEEYVEGP